MEPINAALVNAVEHLKSQRRIKKDADIVEKTGVSKSALSNYLAGRVAPSKPFQQKFSEVFNVDLVAFLPDNRLMLAEAKTDYQKAPEGKIRRRIRHHEAPISMYEVDFEAGKGVEFYDDIRSVKPAYIMDVPDFAGCTAFRTYGQSMEPLINSGAILFGTKDEDWRDYLEYGQIYGIVCTNGRRFLKKVRKSQHGKTHLKLVSENPEYDEFELPVKVIKSMWLIHGWLNKRT